MALLLIMHVFSTVFMTGVIWFVQLVHYPSFLYLEHSKFSSAMTRNKVLTTMVVAPVMLFEVVTWIALVSTLYMSLSPFLLWANSIGLVAICGITVFASMPLHEKLAQGYDARTIKSLVNLNWPRTVLWTARSLGLFLLLRTY